MPITGPQEATWVRRVCANTPYPFDLGVV